MRIIVAPDSFKGSLSAVDAALAMSRGVQAVFPDAEIMQVPVADGGEGTVSALVESTGGSYHYEQVLDPLGHIVKAKWGLLGDQHTAVVEVAQASGLHLVQREAQDVLLSTSYGTGQLMAAALDCGVKRLIVGLGGSATNDGGAGMMQALGVRFLDREGKELTPGGAALADLYEIDLKGLHPRLAAVEVSLASDVTNPLCGEHGASAVYGPQKGASPEDVSVLDAALHRYAEVAWAVTGRDVAGQPGAGAAGGIGAGLMFFTNSTLAPGIDFILDAVRFEEKIECADLVITGEGSTNFQTAFGKAPVGIARVAQRHGVPTLCISGSLGDGYTEVLAKGIDAVVSVLSSPMSLEDCMQRAPQLIETGTANALRVLRAGLMMNRSNGGN